MAQLSIDIGVGVSVVAIFEPCWMDPIIDFLAKDRVLDDEKEAGQVCRIATQYWLLVHRKLYWRSFRGLYLECLPPSKVDKLLTELHKGVCGNHVGGRSLAHQAMT